MGYTHYWTRIERLPAPSFRIFSEACRLMAESMEGKTSNTAGGASSDEPVHIGGPDEGLKPRAKSHTFSRERVAFNGVGEMAHEPLIIERIYKVPEYKKDQRPEVVAGFEAPVRWDFCKTARKPYDVVVVGALHTANILFGSTKFQWKSDGDEDEHRDGRELAERVLTEMGHGDLIAANRMLQKIAEGARV